MPPPGGLLFLFLKKSFALLIKNLYKRFLMSRAKPKHTLNKDSFQWGGGLGRTKKG